MIAVKLMGGLGNQMFQYAIARRLALQTDTSLFLDTSFLDTNQPGCTIRRYELNQLSIHANTAKTEEIAVAQHRSSGLFHRMIGALKLQLGLLLTPPHSIRESTFTFNPETLLVCDNSYLEGYWQSEKYFENIRDQLLCEFQPINPLAGKNKKVADQITETKSISVHVRRGDYITNAKSSGFHGHCSLNYYRRAFSLMEEKIAEPHYYFFSDDIDWVKENMKPRGTAIYIEHNVDKGSEDLRLMSMCHHHIIANSSFSWWGAWLGRNPDKIVIAPDKWFRNDNLDTSDLLPPDWKRITVE